MGTAMISPSNRSSSRIRLFIWIFLIVLLSAPGCASVTTDGTVDPDKLVSRAETAITTLTWTKTVCDTVFDVGCACGKFQPSMCQVYQLSSQGAQLGIDSARNALINYRQNGTVLNEELLMSAVNGLVPLILKFDLTYKKPDTAS